jgi:hypothetical protein
MFGFVIGFVVGAVGASISPSVTEFARAKYAAIKAYFKKS